MMKYLLPILIIVSLMGVASYADAATIENGKNSGRPLTKNVIVL